MGVALIRIVEQHKGSFVYDIYVDGEFYSSIVGLHEAYHEAERIQNQNPTFTIIFVKG